jgi:hypothetical protein
LSKSDSLCLLPMILEEGEIGIGRKNNKAHLKKQIALLDQIKKNKINLQ